jgi:hypothetical protein
MIRVFAVVLFFLPYFAIGRDYITVSKGSELKRLNAVKIASGQNPWVEICPDENPCIIFTYSENDYLGLQLHAFYQSEESLPPKSIMRERMTGSLNLVDTEGYDLIKQNISNLQRSEFEYRQLESLYKDRVADLQSDVMDREKSCFVSGVSCALTFFSGNIGILASPIICGDFFYECARILDDMKSLQQAEDKLREIQKEKEDEERRKRGRQGRTGSAPPIGGPIFPGGIPIDKVTWPDDKPHRQGRVTIIDNP